MHMPINGFMKVGLSNFTGENYGVSRAFAKSFDGKQHFLKDPRKKNKKEEVRAKVDLLSEHKLPTLKYFISPEPEFSELDV